MQHKHTLLQQIVSVFNCSEQCSVSWLWHVSVCI